MRKIYVLALTCFAVALGAVDVKMADVFTATGAVVEKEVLKLDGKKESYALITNTEKLYPDNGITFACLVKANSVATQGGAEIMDTYFAKGGNFILCRWGSHISTRIRIKNSKSYAIMRFARIPKKGEWTHLAVTVTPLKQAFKVTIYFNGKAVAAAEYKGEIVKDLKPWNIGQGWGGPWMLDGEVTGIFYDKKPMSAAEVAALAAKALASVK